MKIHLDKFLLMYSPLCTSSANDIFPFKFITPFLVEKVLSGFKIPIFENKPIGSKEANILS